MWASPKLIIADVEANMERTCAACGKKPKTNAAFSRHFSQCRVRLGLERRRRPRPRIQVGLNSDDEYRQESEGQELEENAELELENRRENVNSYSPAAGSVGLIVLNITLR